MPKFAGALRSVAGWFEERTGLGEALAPAATHPVPRRTASWWYVFGSATLALFVLQIATGICLALVYVPAADQAYDSLRYLNDQAAFGWYLRAIHFWGSNGMVLVMTLQGWGSFAIAFWAWHTPWLYDLAPRSHGWHHVEHTCFFATAMLFWRPVILAWPARSPWPRWTMIP